MNQAIEISTLCRDLRTLMTRAEELLRKVDGRPSVAGVKPGDVNAAEIIVASVSKKFNVPERMIYSRDRHEKIARARQVAMTLIRLKLDLPYDSIGQLFRRDHGTVMSGERAVKNMIETNGLFANDYQALIEEIEKKLTP